jgi:rod shape-determining protein MreD
MSDFSDHIVLEHPRRRESAFRPAALFFAPLAAILLQVYLPLFFSFSVYLELPLLVTVYFSLMRRQPIGGIFIGAAVGLAQDSLSHQPLGMFGIVKTLVGYFAASVSLRFDVENSGVRFILGFFFFFFHQLFYWVLARALLGQQIDFDLRITTFAGVANAVLGVPLFLLLDKLKEEAR